MHVLKSTRYFGVVAVAVALLSSIMPAGAATPPIVSQATAAATLTGSVHDGSGAAVPNAHVTVSGSTTQSTTTDADGNFSVSVPPGLYRVAIDKGGFNAVSL